MAKASHSNSVMRNIPSVDELLRSEAARTIAAEAGHARITELAQRAIEAVRQEVSGNSDVAWSKEKLLDIAGDRVAEAWRAERTSRLQSVINCTGVVIHTNLGRAPLSPDAKQAIVNEAAGYCTLEYDLENGRRGKRAPMCEKLLADLTGAEAALVVNNCAAAAFFVLTVFAAGGEVVISRGELVEIGGDFRVPDVLAQSGATLREVGTTNRTKIDDYAEALSGGSRVILRVHPSNYRIVGFTSTPTLTELAELAHSQGVLLYEDIGSGALIDLSPYGLKDEPIVGDSILAGVDLVTFSGDKLLGGPQAGIIVGSHELIDRLRRHPLYRALRVGKLIYSALEATLASYRKGTESDVPVIAMLALDKNTIRERAVAFISQFNSHYSGPLMIELISGNSAVGGGAAPAVGLETELMALTHPELSAEKLEQILRSSEPSTISRIESDKVLLDLRTVAPAEEPTLLEILRSIA
ncbi:L-seryl-tRNA(Sec) selenium transferase [soil metagenome]